MIKVVLDTNVIVSALISKNQSSPTVQILLKVFSREIIPVYNDYILQEYNNVLHRKKFCLPNNDIENVISFIREEGIHFSSFASNIKLIDPKDVPFFEIVIEKPDLDFLITGNIKHYPIHPKFITARQFIDYPNNTN